MRKRPLFFTIWAIIFVLYLMGVTLFGLLSGTASFGPGLLLAVVRPWVIAGAGLLSLLMTIPLFQFMLSARSRAYKPQVLRPSSDPFVLPQDAEDPGHKAQRLRRLGDQNALSIQLWMLFVVLMSFIGLYLLFFTHSAVRTVGEVTVVPATSTPAIVVAETEPPKEHLPFDRAKFGGIEKTEEQRTADTSYVEAMREQYGSYDDALTAELAIGWQALADRQSDRAMQSFNRAWLIRASSSDALYGMGLVEGVRGHLESSIALIQEAVSLDSVEPAMRCDIARAYVLQSAQAGSSTVELLTRAQDEIDVVEEATAMTPACYRVAAKIARAQGDEQRALGYEAMLGLTSSASSSVSVEE